MMASRTDGGAVPHAMRNFGKALTLLRELRGLRQAQVARAAGHGKSQLSKYENGKELPKLGTLIKVLESMGYTYSDFFSTLYAIDEQELALQEGRVRPSGPVGSGSLGQAFANVVAHLFELQQECTRSVLGLPGRRDDLQE
jgi:transcriptional regulator with XRE-family HTH domain